jgi:hypothetical protein
VRSTRPRRARWKRVLAITGIVIGSVVLLFVLFMAIFGDNIAENSARRGVADLQRRLERPVSVRVIDVSVLRGRAHLQDVRVGPGEDEPKDAPALTLPEARIDVGVLRTLLSFGRTLYVDSIEVKGPELNVVKLADGTLNWERIARRAERTEARERAQPERTRNARNVKLANFDLANANVRFIDTTAGRGGRAKASISNIDAHGQDLGSRGGGDVKLQAAALAPERNVNLHAVLGHAQGDQPPPVEQLALDVKPIELAPLAPFFSARGPAGSVLQRGVLSSSLQMKGEAGGNALTQGWVELARARFEGGKPFDARLDVDAARDPKTGRTNLRNLLLSIGEMKLHATGQIDESGKTTRLQQFAVRSEKLSFDGLRAIYPALDARTAPARFEGGFSLQGTGSGDAQRQNADFEVQLEDTTIDVPDKFHKPRGTPLSFVARVQTTPSELKVDHASLQLADFEVRAQGSVKDRDRKAERYAFTITTPQPAVASVLRLLPPIARARGAAELPGKLLIDAKIEGGGQRVTADGTLRLADLNVDVSGARLKGGGDAKLSMRGTGSHREGRLDADFTQLTAIYQDVLDKPGGTPLRVDATWSGKQDNMHADLHAKLASLAVQAKLALSGRAPHQNFSADVDVPEFAVRPLVAMLPSAAARPIGDVRLGAQLRARGATGRPRTVDMNVPRFTARAGRSQLSGSASAKDLENPQLTAKLRSDYLDTSEFLPETEKEQPARPERQGNSFLARADGKLDVAIKKGKLSDIPIANLRAVLTLRDGRATAKVLDVDAFGGQLEGSGTEIPVATGRGSVHLKGQVHDMQVDALIDRFATSQDLLRGALSGKIDLASRDMTADAIKHTLTGHIDGQVQDAAFLPANGYSQLAAQLHDAAQVPQLKQALADAEKRVEKATGDEWKLSDLRGALKFDNGAVYLPQPITAQTPDGKLSVKGRASVADANDLQGTLALDAKSLTQLSGGKVKFDQAVPVPFSMKGSLLRPEFGFDVASIAEPLAKSYLRGQGGDAVQKEIDKLIEQKSPKGSEKKNKNAKDSIEKGMRRVL